MLDENPFSAPQSSGPIKGGKVSPMVAAKKLNFWQDPLRSQILDVANQQRWLNIHVGIVIVGGVVFGFYGRNPKAGPDTSNLTLLGLLLAVLLIANYAMLFFRLYAMVRGFKSKDSPLAAVLVLFIPIIGLLMLLYYSSKATNFLLQFGIKVGLIGASPRSIIRQLDAAEQAAAAAEPVPASLPTALPMAQAVPTAPPRTAPVAPGAGKPSALPMGKPLSSATPAKTAATGQLPVARPLPPAQPKPAPPKPPQRPQS